MPKGHPFTPAQKSQLYTQIAELAKEHSSGHEIAKLIGASPRTVNYAIADMDLTLKTSEEEKRRQFNYDAIPRLWELHKNGVIIGDLLGITSTAVYAYMRNLGIKRNTRQEVNYPKPHTEMFDMLSEARLAYLCGLIASDGNLHSRGFVRINLQEGDRDSVQFFANSVTDPPTRVIYKDISSCGPKAKQGQYLCAAWVPRFYQYLLNMGITPNKSRTLDVNLDDKSDRFKWYFLRGVIDGDGHIYIPKSGKFCNSALNIASASRTFLTSLQDIFGGSIYESQTPSGLPIFNWVVYASKARIIAENLPLDSFTMVRKTTKLKELLSLERKAKVAGELIGSIWPEGKVIYNSTIQRGNLDVT